MEFFTIIFGVAAYLIGALPTGYLIARYKGIVDIRQHGSGNIGATNVSRLLGIHYFFLTFFIDAGKAALFITIIQYYCNNNYLCLYSAILLFGNICSIFLKGSGGKGVATLLGLIAILQPSLLLPLLGIWLLLLFITKTVGIASVGAIIVLPFFTHYFSYNALFLFSLFATTIVVFKHRMNIMRYFN